MMQDVLSEYYSWLKAGHVIAMIAWMAGMLYLPRLFVYHADAPVGSATSETFKIMERRLLRAIMNPAMIATYVLGFLMIVAVPSLMEGGWLHAKIALVLALSGMHGFFAGCRKKFERDQNTRSATFYRVWNEVPTLAMVLIVVLVIVKPF